MRWREGRDKACGEMSQLFEIGNEPQQDFPTKIGVDPGRREGSGTRPDAPEPSPVGPFDVDGGMLRLLLPATLSRTRNGFGQ